MIIPISSRFYFRAALCLRGDYKNLPLRTYPPLWSIKYNKTKSAPNLIETLFFM